MNSGIPVRCLAMNDLSCVGKCSLGVILPVLAVCGIQTLMLPTGIYSNHLAFETHAKQEMQDVESFLQAWEQVGVEADAVYTGFLANAEQVEIAGEVIAFYGNHRPVLIDPVMGDSGQLYSAYNHDMVAKMKKLVAHADFITPNYTEACWLTESSYRAEGCTAGELTNILTGLHCLGPETVVLTSVLLDGKVANIISRRGEAWRPVYYYAYHTKTYGTGDLFAAALFGCLLRQLSIEKAVEVATDFVCRSVKRMVDAGSEPKWGVPYEYELQYLWTEVERWKKQNK